MESFNDYLDIDISKHIPKKFEDIGHLCVLAEIEYKDSENNPHIEKLKSEIWFVDDEEAKKRFPSYEYDLALKAGESSVTKYLSISHEIKPGDTDYFVIRIATNKSSQFELNFSFRTAEKVELKGEDISLEVFIPRYVSREIEISEKRY